MNHLKIGFLPSFFYEDNIMILLREPAYYIFWQEILHQSCLKPNKMSLKSLIFQIILYITFFNYYNNKYNIFCTKYLKFN